MYGTSTLAPKIAHPANIKLKTLLAGVALTMPLMFAGGLSAQNIHGGSSSSPSATEEPMESDMASEESADDAMADDAMEAGADDAADDGADDAAAAGGGFITEDQIADGESTYEEQCATCHAQDIVSSIAGYPNAWLFYTFVSQAMPANAPGSLDDDQYADIIAYLLSENGHPAGGEVLPPEQEALESFDPDMPATGGDVDAADDESTDDADDDDAMDDDAAGDDAMDDDSEMEGEEAEASAQ